MCETITKNNEKGDLYRVKLTKQLLFQTWFPLKCSNIQEVSG